MNNKLISLTFALSLICSSSIAAEVSEEAVRSAATVSDISALGGAKLSQAEFLKRVVGRKLDEGSWTWTIRKDGSAHSEADDKSWSDDGPWSFKDGKYCRKVEKREKCSEVWAVGSYLRFTDKGEKLAGWTVRVK